MDLNKYYLLESLNNEIRYTKEYVGNDMYILYIKKNGIELLEKYLAELEQIKNSNPSEALERMWCDLPQYYEEEFNTIKQALLKAQLQDTVLKIIIDKEVNLGMLKTCKTVEQYNAGCKIFGGNELTKEEFDTLKEWVK